MKTINVGQNKKDGRSRFVYLGAAKVKAIEVQHTEINQRLLDIIFEIPLEDQKPCEFLVRLETAPEEIVTFHDKLNYAIENPVPHPWLNDMFIKAVTGSTPQELQDELLKKYMDEGED